MKQLAACIVETRNFPDLIQVINEHLKYLPEDVQLFIFHGRQNRFLKTLFPKATLIELVEPMDMREYNALLTSPAFWEHFLGYERVLIFQHDSRILRTGIEAFYEWDYIGASWTWNATYPGNGGLSLRNPKIMHEICSKFIWNGLNEDHWICMHMHDHKIGNLAPIEVADKFSVEGKFILGSWGVHAIDKYTLKEECDQIYNQYL